jgi:hypothetical protein
MSRATALRRVLACEAADTFDHRFNGGVVVVAVRRLTTLDEDRVGEVLYCRPSASTLYLRLPFEEVQGNRSARRIGSQQSAERFARVKHQVIVKLTSDEAVAEAVKLTKLAVEMALDGRW